MSTHLGTSFLNSCLKVPIDPCNNCPAPVYNRPRMYLGRSATATSKMTTTTKVSDYDLDLDTIFTTSGVRSLAKFYDSIPDYCDINHLPEEEFYTTLETLRSTCRTLKSKPSYPFCVRNESSTSSVSQQSFELRKPSKTKASRQSNGKHSKKRAASRKSCAKKECRSISASPCVSSYRNLCERMKILKRHDDIEIERLSEKPLRPPDVASMSKSQPVYHPPKEETKPVEEKIVKEDEPPEPTKQPLTRSNTPCMRDGLRKSFSFSDLNSICWQGLPKKDLPKRIQRFEGEKIKTPQPAENDIPKITVQPASSTESKEVPSKTSSASSRRAKAITRVPFSFLGINDCKLSDKVTPFASPVHPVARPNLAATLREQVSRKKVRELQNNCIFQDSRPPVDWEVRKTPAWKSLSLNESHKEILALRLATRKAEQALQQREYDMQMELMRQRVKSAPLLLEGETFWGPHVGKLSHSCHRDSLKHTCPHGKRTRSKSASSKSQHRKCRSDKLHSRNSNHSTNHLDSDELSSLDRAYL